MLSTRNELMLDVSGEGHAACDPWEPLIVPRATILAEIERLAAGPRPANGRRATSIVHPRATLPGRGFAPGIEVTIGVLKPGEETVPVLCNANQVEICIGGSGTVRAGAREFAVDLHDVWNVPAMQPYAYRNTGTALYARLSYSNAPLLEKLGALYFEEDPKSVEIDAAASAAVQQRHRYARETAPDFSITPEGARLRGYEFLVDIEVLESRAIHWPFTATYPHLMASGNPNARGISLLYNPATERRNGVTHSFFATLAGRGPNVQPSAVGRGHRHSSVAINYYFIGNGGKSIVDGVTYEWGAGDLMLSAPSWSEHAHYVTASPVGNVTLTVQDHPLHIGMESLIWQEKMDGPILTLGSQAGVKGYVGPRRTSD